MLQVVIKAFPMLLMEVDLDGTILGYKSDTPSLFDIHIEDVHKNHLRDIFPSDVTHEYELALAAAKKSGNSSSISYSMQFEDGEHWFEARLVPLDNKKLTVVIQDITKYKKSESKLQKQLEQLSALRAIDQAIAASMDLKLTLSILLTQVIQHLQIDAASVLLWDSKTQALEYTTGIGFHTGALTGSQVKLGQGYAGIAALEQRVIYIENLSSRQTDILRSPSFFEEGFISYYCVPLIAKGQVQGVLEIFKRSPIYPTADWISFLETLGGQAAIAIDNAVLFNNLQRSNAELMLAYNATIEGWSRALDMRDHETEGHTQRVTELVLQLASRVGMKNGELIHIRRGSILHDIGKMGIPDHILHKPGPLTDEEWAIMRRHPTYAKNLLAPIDYLAPAMDIPCYHHERWDGSGYPLGWQTKDIPVSARLFAIVDVFDALTSDRPYRPAWSKADALDYIQQQAGILFDPEFTSIFIQMTSEQYVPIMRRREDAAMDFSVKDAQLVGRS
ncbi:MAG: HD domain-containing phosphohydrolase [Chloroflexota bacterium]